jgi:class 3 adenylate cyclase
MPLFMDIHKLSSDVTPIMVEKAHEADVAIQNQYGVRYRGYWYNADTHTVVCLAEGPNAEACDAVHRLAHGLQADSIIEVPADTLQAFLGGGMVSASGETLRSDGARDNGLRVLLVTEIDNLADVGSRHGDDAAAHIVDCHDRIVRDTARANDGREVRHTGDGMILSFASASAAVRCALEIRRECAAQGRDERDTPSLRIGIAAGEPVARGETLFGVVVDQARAICRAAGDQKILVSVAVRELCQGKGLAFTPPVMVRVPGSNRSLEVVSVAEGSSGAAVSDRPDPATEQLRNMNAALAPRYAVDREVGRGGMATVYLVRDLRHDRQVAMKVLRSEWAASLGTERFLREIRVAARLTHPNIVPLFDSGEAAGWLYYVMPHLDGETLRQMIRRERQLPLEYAIQVARSVAAALDYAHRQGVIHRDIKPENILLHEGQPMVLDFGIALALQEAGGDRLTESGFSLGTPVYMSPEQAAGNPDIDVKSDVYALGCVLYEALLGDPPFTAPNVPALVAKILTEPPRRLREDRPAVPAHVDDAVQRALAKDPADRFDSAGEFAAALVAAR